MRNILGVKMEEKKIIGGINKNIEIVIYEDYTTHYFWHNFGQKKEYNRKVLIARIVSENYEELMKLARPYRGRIETPCLQFYNVDNECKLKRGEFYIVIDEKDYEELEKWEKKVEEENDREYERVRTSIPLRFVVREESLRLLDMYYDALVFMPNREMTKEEEERYKKLKKAVEKFGHNKWHLDGYIDAREYEVGKEFSLEELERMFSGELEKLDEDKKRRKDERERKERELEEKRKQAIEEAKRTGKKVIIRRVGSYDGDDWREVELYGTEEIRRNFGDLGLVIVYEVATPKGEITEEHCPCY